MKLSLGLRAVVPQTLQLEWIQMCFLTDFGPQGIDRKLDLKAKESHREPSHAHDSGLYSVSK